MVDDDELLQHDVLNDEILEHDFDDEYVTIFLLILDDDDEVEPDEVDEMDAIDVDDHDEFENVDIDDDEADDEFRYVRYMIDDDNDDHIVEHDLMLQNIDEDEDELDKLVIVVKEHDEIDVNE